MWALLVGLAFGHAMPEQHGTLNFTDKGGYFVASVPVSAFVGFDDDADSALSGAELERHRADLEAQVHGAVALLDPAPRSLEGVLFDLQQGHHGPGPAHQVLLMGRFPPTDPQAALRFELFGTNREPVQIRFRHGERTEVHVFATGNAVQALSSSRPDPVALTGAGGLLATGILILGAISRKRPHLSASPGITTVSTRRSTGPGEPTP